MAADGGDSPQRTPRAGGRGGSHDRPGASERSELPGASERSERGQRPGRPERGQRHEGAERARRTGRPVKPSAAGLGVDLATLDWQRSGTDDGALEVAFVPTPEVVTGPAGRPRREDVVQWVLLRVAGDPAGRVLVYDRTEWLSFLDGAGNGEFDSAAELARADPYRLSRSPFLRFANLRT